MRTGLDQPTSTYTESASAGRLPVPSGVEVGEIPVESRLEPHRERGGDVGGKHRLREQNGVVALVANELREHVDTRLRQRRREPLVVRDPDRARRRTHPRLLRSRARPSRSRTPATSPPSCAAFVSTPSEPFWIAPS